MGISKMNVDPIPISETTYNPLSSFKLFAIKLAIVSPKPAHKELNFNLNFFWELLNNVKIWDYISLDIP